ncbi:MAG: dockerin type I repeat-containing protein [Oscillospiraceae bacterium]|nr:dockerin type I repeat-containing protein [Oscillospiraceae bacterium]
MMMKRRVLAIAAALACMAGCLPTAVFAQDIPLEESMETSGMYCLVVDAETQLINQLRNSDGGAFVGFGHLGCFANLDERLAGQKPLEDGDILWISHIDSIAEIYPCCIHLAEDTVVKNMGNKQDIAEKKTLVISRDAGLLFYLQDEENVVYSFYDGANDYLENYMMDAFTAGDSVDFWVYKDRAVEPIGKAETPIFEPQMFVVVDQYEYDSGNCGFVLMDGDGYTYTLSEEQVLDYLLKGEKYPEYGDILGLQGMMEATEKDGTNWMSVNFISPKTNEWEAPGVMKNHGSVIENGETAVFEIVQTYKDKTVVLEDADGQSHRICTDYLEEGDPLYDAKLGEKIEMYTYQGKPQFPVEQTILPVNEYAVVGIKDDDFAIMHLREDTVHFLSAEDAAELLPDGQNAPKYGDILKIMGYPSVTDTDSISFYLDYKRTKDGGEMQTLASVTEDNLVQKFRYWKEQNESFCTLTYLGEDVRKVYNYELGYTDAYLQPEGFDWSALKLGTYVDMLTYEDKPILPIYIEVKEVYTKYFVVVGVDDAENPQNFVLMMADFGGAYNPGTYYLDADIIEEFYKGAEPIKFGDVLRFQGKFEADGRATTQHFTSFADYTVIEKTDSVFDDPLTEVYTISPSSLGNLLKMQKEGFNTIRTFMDFTETYQMPGAISWKDIRDGDKAEMLIYNNVPCIPISVDPLGDADGSGSLDILDVIVINRHILGAAELPAAKRAPGELGQADFNGNGRIDADDSLGMLKRIVGIA